MAGLTELWKRLRVLFTFARVLRVDDSGDLQLVQLEGLIGEIREGVPRIGEWGLASNPPANAQAVVLALGANRAQLVVLGVEDRETRETGLATGETRLYAIGGNVVRLAPTGAIEITGPAGSVVVAADGSISITGPVGSLAISAAGAVTLGALSISATSAGAVTITGAGAITITGGSVSIGPDATIGGKAFLAHTHTSASPGDPTSPPL